MSAWPELSRATHDALRDACARIAPSWPLDQLIAVNPFWEMRQRPFAEVAARMAALGQVQCLMDVDYYRSLWLNPVQAHHLEQAVEELGLTLTVDDLLAPAAAPAQRHWYNVSDLVDSEREQLADSVHRMSWHEEIIHQISQFCGDLLSTHERTSLSAETVYQRWLDSTRSDRGLAILMREPALQEAFAQLPNRVEDLFAQALSELAPDDAGTGDYALALLLDINGWASALAWLRWQARLNGQDNNAIEGLLAIRLAWDWVLWQLNHRRTQSDWPQFWQRQWSSLPALLASHASQQQRALAWQRASEIAYQCELVQVLSQPLPEASPAPVLQAAFCIDVRSEIMRRALEAQYQGIETLGFAGFFGLPLAYQPAGSGYQRPQLPGLLAPAITVRESGAEAFPPAPGQRANHWDMFSASAPSTFTAVESGGLFYLFKLLRQSLFPGPASHPVNALTGGSGAFQLTRNGAPVPVETQAELALAVLTAMGLRGRLAHRVLLVGHGSNTCNNPHAAGLDCGACGGQTGEVNVRVLAQLLNDPDVRAELKKQGEDIPPSTRFVPALHDTTTDDIHCFAAQDGDLDNTVRGWLKRASMGARQERAARLGLDGGKDLTKSLRQRSRDWSQVRPEWGLADNASFIVAPRARTRHINLHGRTFLHDYDWRRDTGFALLETIMTAPMVVTHWINMQYNASVTDNTKLGCGNKALHNVVGGNLGVFEGNGGDLRIGLPFQSVNNGQRWMHQPLRLSVFIAAPQEAIADVLAAHETVRQLVENDWLYLFRLGDEPGQISRWYHGRFQAVSAIGKDGKGRDAA
ncbi:MAG: DUF2309 domain-containing protein [Alcanivoracaceae bacterium]|nr:DUF2309 domain-containing protein [Alcanivoracaceae bacterium]